MEHKFLQKLDQGPVLGDGAMGTLLYERGIYINRNFDQLNVTEPHLVKAVHRDYIVAGAEVIETNTFGANRFKLSKYGLADESFNFSKAGAELARQSAREASGILVAGSMGPLGKPVAPVGTIQVNEALDAFRTQASGLLAGGVDLFMLETFIDLTEIGLAVLAVRELSDLPIVAMMTTDLTDLTAYGRSPEQVAAELTTLPVEVIGLNCSIGPHHVLDGVVRMRKATDKPLAAFPNAGEPRMVDDRILYMSTPEYFADYTRRLIQSGVQFVGGSCGTSPRHIRAMRAALDSLRPISGKRTIIPVNGLRETVLTPEVQLKPRAERSALGKLLDEGTFPVSCELAPPRSSDVTKILQQVRLLKKAGIDVVNIPDGPRASARISPMILAYLIRREIGMDTILHYACRDRNILGMQSDLLGADALGLSNILAVTGDPPKLGDYPMASAVFDVDSIGLRIADHLNHARDLAGNPIAHPTSFFWAPDSIPEPLTWSRKLTACTRRSRPARNTS